VRRGSFTRIIVVISLLVAALVAYRLWMRGNAFPVEELSLESVYSDVELLSSPEYDGRKAGTDGNERSLRLIRERFRTLGVAPAGVAGSYDQPFEALIPEFGTNPLFTVRSAAGETLATFEMYRDYRLAASGAGSGIDFTGELILVGDNIYAVDPIELRDRVVVVESVVSVQEKVEYVRTHGARGVFFVPDRYRLLQDGEELGKTLSTEGQRGPQLLVGNLAVGAHRELKSLAGTDGLFGPERRFAVIPRVSLRAEISFPIVDTANILGVIAGRRSASRVLIISADADGLGSAPGDAYFPGAANNAAGLAVLLEVARIMAHQDNLPYKHVVFACWNAEENQSSGSRFYANNPLFPLEQTTVIHLGSIGGPGGPFVQFTSDAEYGRLLRKKMAQYARDAGVPATDYGIASGWSLDAFAENGVAGSALTTGDRPTASLDDAAESLDEMALRNAAVALLTYLKRDIYRDRAVDYLGAFARVALWVLVAIAMASSIITALYNARPDMRILSVPVERIYTSLAAEIVRRVIFYVLPIALALFLFVLLVNLPPDGMIARVNGERITNYSGYLSLKRTIGFIGDFFRGDVKTVAAGGSILGVVLSASARSMSLLGAGLALSLVLGLVRGVLESRRRSAGGSLRSFATLVMASVPDVAVVLAGLWLYVVVSRRFPGFTAAIRLTDFILPLLTLSILPAAYVSRMTRVAIQVELGKDYVTHARAKGYSPLQIYLREILPAVVSASLDSIPTLMTVMLTNLIIVEYLFNYQGIIYYLLYFFRRHDAGSFVALSLAVAGVYIIFVAAARGAAYLLDPLRRKKLL
jgi:ABC-type dipeptide/oligopeptide/nickel transport system permease component